MNLGKKMEQNPTQNPSPNQPLGRRSFLKSATLGGAGVVAGASASQSIAADKSTESQVSSAQSTQLNESAQGYVFLNPEEAAFIEALVNHMIPKDEYTPSGVEMGLPIYIDRALAGGWGKGDRQYTQGPWREGTPSQGYQLPLTPAQLYKAGIAEANKLTTEKYQKTFDYLTSSQKEEFLISWQSGKLTFSSGINSKMFFTILYQNVMEGIFSDPIYGGNKDKVGWKLIGFPGAIAVHREHIDSYKDKRFPNKPISISDMS